MKYLIDLSGMIDLETFHEYLSKKLDFPAYYGQNFDAFWDCLLDMDSTSKIRVEGLSDFRKNLPEKNMDKLNSNFLKIDQVAKA